MIEIAKIAMEREPKIMAITQNVRFVMALDK
jgi:hypothetical protein